MAALAVMLAALLPLSRGSTSTPVRSADTPRGGAQPQRGRERIVFQTSYGDLHMALFPEIAPVTAKHIRRLAELGAFNGNHIFRVDAGFVAQVAAVGFGRELPLDAVQAAEEAKQVPLEVAPDRVRHDRRGLLSMARRAEPDSGTSSFSIMLGPAPHLDGAYAIFGELVAGWDALSAIEQVHVRREGIFVMPEERITIVSSYVYTVAEDGGNGGDGDLLFQHRYCTEELQQERGGG